MVAKSTNQSKSSFMMFYVTLDLLLDVSKPSFMMFYC